MKPSTRIRDLPVETQQAVEIARALAGNARLLILDEPTAVLAPGAAEALFARLRRLRDSGVTILVILHKIREVLAVADTVTVLRGGRLVEGPEEVAAMTADRLARSIIGSAPTGSSRPKDDETKDDLAALVGAEMPHGMIHNHTTAARTVVALSGVSTRPGAGGVACASSPSNAIPRGSACRAHCGRIGRPAPCWVSRP